MLKPIRYMLFFSGIVLIGFNLAGIFLPLRNPAIYTEVHNAYDKDITLTESQFYAIISQRDTSDEKYVERVNRAVNQGIAHYGLYWEEWDTYNLRVPVHENYLLFFFSYLKPYHFTPYEYCDTKKAIERGVGLCSQHAMIATDILQSQGIDAKIIPLGLDHVVATAQIDKHSDIWWVIDPDYGVIIKHDIQTIERDPHIIKPYYQAMGYNDSIVNNLVDIYGKEIAIVDNVTDYCGTEKQQLERTSYFLIWIIPVVLMLPGFLGYIRQW